MNSAMTNTQPERRSGPTAILRSFLTHRALIKTFILRELESRYRASLLGKLWYILTPALMIVIFTFVFGVVFQARVPYRAGDSNPVEFGAYIFSGLIIFNFLSEILSAAPNAIPGNTQLVKRVVFPLEILGFVSVSVAFVNVIISFAALLIAMQLIFGAIPIQAVIYPFVVILMIPMLLGFYWFFASVGAFLRDVGQFIGVSLSALMFFSPIFLPLEKLPPGFAKAFLANPVSVPVEAVHIALFKNELPPIDMLVVYTLVSFTIMFVGWATFQRLRDGFADVV